MTHDDDIRWLAGEQPLTAAPDAAATARARDDLLAHAAEARPALARPLPRRRGGRAERRWLRPSRVLALAGVAGVAAAVAIGAPLITGGDGPLAVSQASAAPLVALSGRVLAEPAPAGDATLVLRTHHFPDAAGFTGADLYLDDGRYYYGPTVALLRKDIAADIRQSDSAGREMAVAAAAASPDLAVEQARERMVRATWAPGTPVAAAEAPAAASSAPAQAQLREKLADSPEVPAASQQTLDENRIWMGCMDALLAGAGRRDVRAGALRILASVASVTVGPATVDGTAVLQLTSTGFGDGYRETLSIDSVTGVPIRFEGGHPGAEPSVVMDYSITRVTAAKV